MTPNENKIVALLSGEESLRKSIQEALPPNFSLQQLSSILDCPRALTTATILIIPEVLAECSGLDVLNALSERKSETQVWFLSVDNSLREKAFEHKADDYITVPIGSEFKAKIASHRENFSGDLGGELEAISPFNLFQFLFSSQVTGVLRVLNPRVQIYFDHGELIDAFDGKENGEKVLLDLLRAPAAGRQFSFERLESVKGITRTISQRTDHLLLGIASAIDEGESSSLQKQASTKKSKN